MSDFNSRRDFMTRGAAGVAMTAAGWNRVLGSNDRVRLGVIGTGNRGSDVMSWFQKEPDVEVVALCDCYDKALNNALKMTEGKAKTYTDYRALLASKEVDAVLIATPDQWHKQMGVDACKAGKDIYIEKPLTFSIEEGHEPDEARLLDPRVLAEAKDDATLVFLHDPQTHDDEQQDEYDRDNDRHESLPR